MSMANTNTTIMKFLALAKSRGKVLALSTQNPVPETTVVSVILAGLLREFDPVVTILETMIDDGEFTLKKVESRLKDYAHKHKLLTVTKAGEANGRNRTFNANATRPQGQGQPRTFGPSRHAWTHMADNAVE